VQVVLTLFHYWLRSDLKDKKSALLLYVLQITASMVKWLTCLPRVSCAGGLEFKSRTGQILHSVANSSPPLQHLRKWLYCLGAMTRRWAPQTRYTLRRYTVYGEYNERLRQNKTGLGVLGMLFWKSWKSDILGRVHENEG